MIIRIIGKLYQKYRYMLENGLFIILLAFYPLMNLFQSSFSIK